MAAGYTPRGNVAVITLDNPPVNGLGYDTRTGVAAGVERAVADPAIVAIVITGAAPTSRSSAAPRPSPSPTC